MNEYQKKVQEILSRNKFIAIPPVDENFLPEGAEDIPKKNNISKKEDILTDFKLNEKPFDALSGAPEMPSSDLIIPEEDRIVTESQNNEFIDKPDEYQDALDHQRRVLMMSGLAKAFGKIGSSIGGLGGQGAILSSDVDTSAMEKLGELPLKEAKDKLERKTKASELLARLTEKAQARQDRLDAREDRKNESEANRELRRLLGIGSLQTRQTALEQKENEDLKNRIAKFSTRIEKSNIPEQINSLNNINKIMEELGGSIYNPPKKDIPGIGIGVSSMPDFLISSKGVDLRQNISALANAVLKSRSGASVTDPEFKRFLREASTGNFSREEDTMKWIKKMADLTQQDAKNIESYDPELKKTYSEYTGEELPSEKIQFSKQQKIQTESNQNEVERLDKKTGKTAIFDNNTKQFIRWK